MPPLPHRKTTKTETCHPFLLILHILPTSDMWNWSPFGIYICLLALASLLEYVNPWSHMKPACISTQHVTSERAASGKLWGPRLLHVVKLWPWVHDTSLQIVLKLYDKFIWAPDKHAYICLFPFLHIYMRVLSCLVTPSQDIKNPWAPYSERGWVYVAYTHATEWDGRWHVVLYMSESLIMDGRP